MLISSSTKPDKDASTVYSNDGRVEDAQAPDYESSSPESFSDDQENSPVPRQRKRSDSNRSRSSSPRHSKTTHRRSHSSHSRGKISERAKSVLRERAQEIRQERRHEEALKMTGTRRSSRQQSSKKGRSSSGKAKEQSNKRKPTEDDDKSTGGDAQNSELLAQIAELQAANASLNASLQKQVSKKAKKSTAVATNVPCTKALLDDVVLPYVEGTLWRATKFIASWAELHDVGRKIMREVPEFQAYLADKEEANANIQSFIEFYGGEICKAINEKRTNAANGMLKAYKTRYGTGAKMPTPKQLRAVIRRKKAYLEVLPIKEELLPIDDKLPAKEKEKIRAENDKILAENAKNKAHNDANADWQDWFGWYWECLLPCVVGKHRWGYSLRYFNTICAGTYPDSNTKYITSSDEAFVMVVFENCETRYPYAAEIGSTPGAKCDQKDPRYQSKWTDSRAGSKQFGGWNLAGRTRYYDLVKFFAKCKKQKHVLGVEKAALYRLRMLRGLESTAGNKNRAGVMDYEGKEEANVALLDYNSDDESTGGDMSDLEEGEAVGVAARKQAPQDNTAAV